jgi:Na+/proline symporter
MESNKSAAIAAAIIMVGFGVVAFYLPNIMLAIGNVSPAAAGLVAVLFVAAFFLVFWLRARSRGKRK